MPKQQVFGGGGESAQKNKRRRMETSDGIGYGQGDAREQIIVTNQPVPLFTDYLPERETWSWGEEERESEWEGGAKTKDISEFAADIIETQLISGLVDVAKCSSYQERFAYKVSPREWCTVCIWRAKRLTQTKPNFFARHSIVEGLGGVAGCSSTGYHIKSGRKMAQEIAAQRAPRTNTNQLDWRIKRYTTSCGGRETGR